MFLSIFDMFKIGIGPSSSHTMGPMIACKKFIDYLIERNQTVETINVELFGSLAHTGVGHATDRAVLLGLMGFQPDTYNETLANEALGALNSEKRIILGSGQVVRFDPERNLIFNYERTLEQHSNALMCEAFDMTGRSISRKLYFSIGGGFVVEADGIEAAVKEPIGGNLPFPFTNFRELKYITDQHNMSIAEIQLANELVFTDYGSLEKRIFLIWSIMEDAIDRGLKAKGTLPGGLNVKRRAGEVYNRLALNRTNIDQTQFLFPYAMASNEENAAGSKIVTAPTNGAAGVIPAVVRYWLKHTEGAKRSQIADFFLTAAAIGGLIKNNASISGAEAGCQAEVGSASAMAAAGLCAVCGGSVAQVECAAEIALEHHLGMTCDPIMGLVQVPCIERNGFGAIKAVAACRLALIGDGNQLVSLDECIDAMRRTGEDMSSKYKETSLGGLAKCVPNC